MFSFELFASDGGNERRPMGPILSAVRPAIWSTKTIRHGGLVRMSNAI